MCVFFVTVIYSYSNRLKPHSEFELSFSAHCCPHKVLIAWLPLLLVLEPEIRPSYGNGTRSRMGMGLAAIWEWDS